MNLVMNIRHVLETRNFNQAYVANQLLGSFFSNFKIQKNTLFNQVILCGRACAFFVVFIFVFSPLYSQIHYLSDCFHGGIVGDGYQNWNSVGISSVNLPVPSGVTIKKALFFSNIYKYQDSTVPVQDKLMTINGNPLVLSEDYSAGNTFEMMQGAGFFLSTVVVDITNYIVPGTSNYVINPYSDYIGVDITPLFADIYMVVLYEDPTMPLSCVDIYLNTFNTAGYLTYPLQLGSANTSTGEVGLGVNASQICVPFWDWYSVWVDNDSIGAIGGEEDNTNAYCGGVIGAFDYHNTTVYDNGNDTGDSLMWNLDALANIQPYINGAENFDVSFNYFYPLYPSGKKSNVISQLYVTYSSSCSEISAVVSADTTICQGEQVQLHAGGGQSYEWQPSNGLSCTDCADPILTGDSSRLYTVRIRSNDSCSVVRPVKVIVRPRSFIESISSVPAVCGTSTGSVTVSALSLADVFLIGESDTLTGFSGTVSGLSAGTYTLYVTDTNACNMMDSVITISSVNNTVADFTVSSQSGGAPLVVSITNTSQQADAFWWEINGEYAGDNLGEITLDTAGSYFLILVAWQYSPDCADTVLQLIEVYDSIEIVIPNVFTPNGDGVNDEFGINVTRPVQCDIQVLNRWGEVVFNYNGVLNSGFNSMWNGKEQGYSVSDGIYFYKATFSPVPGWELNGLPLTRGGFFEVAGE